MNENNLNVDLSIIIPFYKRDNFILDILNGLDNENIRLGLSIEVIFVDSNSSTNIDEIINSYLPTSKLDIKKIDTFNSASHKRNFGIKNAKSNNIISIDDDCITGDNFISIHYKSLKEKETRVINSGIVNFSKNSYKNSNYYRYRNERHRIYDKIYFKDEEISFYNIVTMNMSFKKDELTSENLLFDEDYTFYGLEDTQFGLDCIKKGFKLKTCLAPIIHQEDTSISKFLKKIEDFTENFLKFYKKNVDSLSSNKSLSINNENIAGIKYLHFLVRIYLFVKYKYVLQLLRVLSFMLVPFEFILKFFLIKTDSKKIFYFFKLYKILTIIIIVKTLFGKIR